MDAEFEFIKISPEDELLSRLFEEIKSRQLPIIQAVEEPLVETA